MEKPLILLSGGFDPYHDGHAAMFKDAAKLGDICVILNSDDWLIKKKGCNFMTLKERAGVLESIVGVTHIWHSVSLNSVCEDLIKISQEFKGRFLIFAKGGDRNASNTPEQEVCEKLDMPVIFGLGGNNQQSSSKLLAQYHDNLTDISGVYELAKN